MGAEMKFSNPPHPSLRTRHTPRCPRTCAIRRTEREKWKGREKDETEWRFSTCGRSIWHSGFPHFNSFTPYKRIVASNARVGGGRMAVLKPTYTRIILCYDILQYHIIIEYDLVEFGGVINFCLLIILIILLETLRNTPVARRHDVLLE